MQMSLTANRLSVAALLTLTALSATACKKSQNPESGSSTGSEQLQTQAAGGDTVRIGEVGSMTGSEATFGQSTHNGVLLALKQINGQGGVKGKKVEVSLVDDG